MGYFSVGGSEVLRRVVYSPFISLWRTLRNLTGRQRREQNAADATVKAHDKQAHMNRWKASRDR